jgi:hypothetical protein
LDHEKTIALTIVDPELVRLIKAMHNRYAEFRHGFYSTASSKDTRSEKVTPFELFYRKSNNLGLGGSAEQYTYSRVRID